MIKLLLVDDQSIVRQGLRMRLLMEPDIVVIGEASSGEQAIELVESLTPDIVLMDVEMPGMDGITATAALRENTSQSAVVIMSIHDDVQTPSTSTGRRSSSVRREVRYVRSSFSDNPSNS